MKRVLMCFTFAATLILFIAGCKKDENATQPPNNTTDTGCNFTTDVVAVNGVTKNIVKTNCNVFGTFGAEFLVDSNAAAAIGVVLLFSTTTSPDTGIYTIVDSVNLVATGKVYVEYYDPTNAWKTSAGSVRVSASGAQKVFTFCSVDLFVVPTNKKTVSLRGTCN